MNRKGSCEASGHCVGSVWYHFEKKSKSILFSGDYTEDTQIYAADPIRGRSADLAVLDCAYGKDMKAYDSWWYREDMESGENKVFIYSGRERNGIVFVSNPQLCIDAAREIAKSVIAQGGHGIFCFRCR